MEAVAATAAPVEAQDARALAGDREAFNSLYRPHFEAVYDFVLRIVRERELAADVVRETFARAWRAFPEQGSDVAAWLFAASRSSALDALRYRRDRNGAEREALHFTSVDVNRVPNATVGFDQALVELVWDAAAALSREEYSLLALYARQHISPEEIGESAAGIARLRATLDDRVAFKLVAGRARHACTELELLVAEGGEQAVAWHIRRCERCDESMRAFVSPTAVLGSLERLSPPGGLEREIFKRAPRRRVFGIL
jgi:RNA polymerase sigma-70 factor (ECF subfamily)